MKREKENIGKILIAAPDLAKLRILFIGVYILTYKVWTQSLCCITHLGDRRLHCGKFYQSKQS